MSHVSCQLDSFWTNKNIFHAAMLALTLTGLFMAFSAEDLGSAGPVIISLGISLIVYSLIAEALLGLLYLAKIVAVKVSSEKPAKEAE